MTPIGAIPETDVGIDFLCNTLMRVEWILDWKLEYFQEEQEVEDVQNQLHLLCERENWYLCP
jgi:hypothetical protein